MQDQTPSESLIRDHLVILRVLACLERTLDDAVRRGRVEERDADDALTFFETFAGSYHNSKEEDVLFPAARAATKDMELAQRMFEHDIGRSGLVGMREHLDAAAAGDASALRAFLTFGRNFAAGWRAHIAEEEQNLFPAIESLLDAGAVARVLSGFRDADRRLAPGAVDGALALARRLASRLGVPLDG